MSMAFASDDIVALEQNPDFFSSLPHTPRDESFRPLSAPSQSKK
jgi:hypothetical protein